MTDNHEFERRALALLNRAFDKPKHEREAFIRSEASSDIELAERVLSLLNAESEETDFLPTAAGAESLNEVEPPEQIGPFRITKKLGEGGMGAIFLGERVTDDFSQQVAIKFVRAGQLSEKLSQRLKQERQTLSNLNHPNIAQLFDGGETDNGVPYFIMEYVEGQTLNAYLKKNAPNNNERLRIFSDMLRAVAYAHRNLIIHRDLSPANTLVTDDGFVKLIDFGISHTLPALGEESNVSRHTATKGYASPEQMRGEPTSTLSDIYSLGALLSDLIETASFAREDDLRAITTKAMSTEPGDRYLTVDAFMEDLKNYSNGRPVRAVDKGWTYPIQRFVGRHPLSTISAVVGITSLTLTAILMTALFVRAERAEAFAETRFNEVRQLANFMMFDLHDDIASMPGSTPVRERLIGKAKDYLDILAATPRAQADLKLDTAIGYRRLGDVLGNPIGANLGRREEATQYLQLAESELTRLLKQSPDNPAVIRALADTYYSQSVFHFIALDKNEEAASYAQKSENAYNDLFLLTEPNEQDKLNRIAAIAQDGVALVWVGKGEEAISRVQTAITDLEDLLKENASNTKLQFMRAELAVKLGDTMSRHNDRIENDDYTEALAHITEGISRYRQLLSTDMKGKAENALIGSLFKISLVLYGLERDQEALDALQEAEEITERLLIADPENKELARRRLAVIQQSAMSLAYLSRFGEANSKSALDLAGRHSFAEGEPQNTGYLRELANAYVMHAEVAALGEDWPTACARYQKSSELYKQVESDHGVPAISLEVELREVTAGLAQCVEKGIAQ